MRLTPTTNLLLLRRFWGELDGLSRRSGLGDRGGGFVGFGLLTGLLGSTPLGFVVCLRWTFAAFRSAATTRACACSQTRFAAATRRRSFSKNASGIPPST